MTAITVMMRITVGNAGDRRWGISGNVWQREIVPIHRKLPASYIRQSCCNDIDIDIDIDTRVSCMHPISGYDVEIILILTLMYWQSFFSGIDTNNDINFVRKSTLQSKVILNKTI